MLLGLSSLMDRPGESMPFSVSVDLSDLQFGTCYPVSEPVTATGSVRNTADVLVMKGLIRTTLHGICDRCTESFTQAVELPLDVVLVQELANEDSEDEGVFSLVDDCTDLEEIVRTVFVLNLDSKLLCSPECKGLCCRCGANLNRGPCSCEKEIDPRFAALRQLLDK